MERITKNLIASCGMNCGVCLAHLREKNKCPGCRKVWKDSPKTRCLCQLRNCKKRVGEFCFTCAEFPCERLKKLDKRYQAKYGMSEIENLKHIRDKGINEFTENERKRWQSSKGLFCVHDKKYY